MRQPKTATYAAAAVVVTAVVLGVVGYRVMVARQADEFAACRNGQIAAGAGAIGGPFTLTDESGKTVTDKDVIKGPTLIYFGYTFCPDLCPVDNARNAEATDILAKRGIDVTPVFISFDPKRDTPQQLKLFTENLSPKMIGLTGTEAQLKAVTKEYHVYFKVKNASDPYYLFDHSTFTYLMMPGRGFIDFFRRDETPEQMANRVECFVKAAHGV